MFEDTNEAGVAALISDKEKMRRRRISDSKKGGKLSQETKDKISQKNAGKKRSEESKAQLSKFHKGKKLTEEVKSKISDCLMAFGPDHPAAVDWCFKSPQGDIMQGFNLQHLIRINVQYFEEKDVVWRKTPSGLCCIAYHALTRLKAGEGKPWGRKSWKGWILAHKHSTVTEKETVT